MHELTFLTALLAGLFGSTHCLAMCGGIATALGSATQGARAWQPLLYHGGRLLSYGTAGAIAGALGAAAGFAFAVSSWGAILRLGTAVMVIVIGLDISLGTSAVAHWLRTPERWGARLWRRLAPARGVMLVITEDSGAGHLAAAVGAVALAVLFGVRHLTAAALIFGSAAAGALVRLGFGLGTVPAMSTLSYAGSWLPQRDGLMARLLGALLVACGLWTAITPVAILSGSPEHRHLATPAGRVGAAPASGNPIS